MIRTFDAPGNFASYDLAATWLKSCGFSVGRMQGSDPIGILYGCYDIQEWRNLSRGEVAALDGMITGNKRHGPVTVTLRDGVPDVVRAAFAGKAPIVPTLDEMRREANPQTILFLKAQRR